jgi:DNA-binding response OmpR family regulator
MDQSPLRSDIYSPLQILVFSDNVGTRRQIELALGRFPDARLGALNFRAVATQPAVICEISNGAVDLLILDAEAAPLGGMGVAKQLKDELLQHLPIVLVISRAADRWLASWSQADAVVMSPIDPGALRDAVLPLLRRNLRH